ncbi:hypothetical protein, partial [Streptomyces sp. SM14]|uniref:hypothetical protein n=2 Tax=unclassified Streptomyces TaxID=2593676 RepID=UPI0011B05644
MKTSPPPGRRGLPHRAAAVPAALLALLISATHATAYAFAPDTEWPELTSWPPELGTEPPTPPVFGEDRRIEIGGPGRRVVAETGPDGASARVEGPNGCVTASVSARNGAGARV